MVEQPFALIVGDSISMGYTPLVKEMAVGRLEIERIPPNGGDTANVLTHLDEWLEPRAPVVVHLNCGLHDVRKDRVTGAPQQPKEAYAQNLREIVRYLRETTIARLIWATTTPVIDARHNRVKDFDRFESDVLTYNAAALEVMTAMGVEIDDLHAAVVTAGAEDCLGEDGVHMTPKGNLILAHTVARCLLA